MNVESLTDVGRRRSNNEDVPFTAELPSGYTLLAVADGVGGARGGEVASATAIEVLSAALETPAVADPGEALMSAFYEANARVHRDAGAKTEVAGMSTTLVAALVRGREAWIANVGDSRAYLIEGGRARQLTEDHSLVAERERAGLATEGESSIGFGRNIITRSVGSQPKVEVDVFGPIELPVGGSLLLSSDGLHDMIDDEQIAGAFTGEDAAPRLIAMANEAGGSDNIAVALIRGIE